MNNPSLLEDDRLSAKLDVYGVVVPEPVSVLLVAPAVLLLFIMHFRSTSQTRAALAWAGTILPSQTKTSEQYGRNCGSFRRE